VVGEKIPEDLRTPISKILLKENDNLALIFPREIAKKPLYHLYFFRIMRRYPLHRTYDEEIGDLSAGATKDFAYMGEAELGKDKDIVRIRKERPWRLYHFGIGIRPSEIWLYRSCPAGTPQTGFGYEEPPKVADKRDYIPGYLSPYDDPTVATESIIYHKLSFHIGLKNDSSRMITPSLGIFGAGYDTCPITDREFINKMLAGIKPVRYVTIGGLRMFTYAVPDEWEGNEVPVDKETIERIMRAR